MTKADQTDPNPEMDEEARKALRKARRERMMTEAAERAAQAAVKATAQAGKPAPQNEPAPKVVEIAPIAPKARMRPRHWGIVFSFIMFVLLPIAASGWYLWERAVDQYASTVAFTVRQEQGGAASDLLTGFAAQVGGGGGSADSAILYEFIQSQQLVALIDEKFDLEGHYSAHWDQDPIFSLTKNPTLEEMVDHWQSVVSVSYDEGSGLIELRVLAYDPVFAQSIATEIVAMSQDVINGLNEQARNDTIQFAEADLATAQERLRQTRSALTLFRTRTQLVDPETDLAGRLGVVNTLQQQLAEAFIEYDLLVLSTSETDPRVQQAARRIDVIRDRLAEERSNVANGDGTTAAGEDYPSLLAEYESLLVDRQFAEENYRASLAAVDIARANAARQSRYLAAFIEPTLPETAEFPQRLTLLGFVSLFLLLSWTILALIYYSVRDSR